MLVTLLLFFPCCDSEFPIEELQHLLFYTMSDTKIRAPPSHYPFLAFHLIRTCSLVCSTIVSGILLYFCYWLKHDNYKIPWTFLVVCQSVSACVRMTLISFSASRSITPYPDHPHRHLPLPYVQQPFAASQPFHQHPPLYSMGSGHRPSWLEYDRDSPSRL